MSNELLDYPRHVFRFAVEFTEDPLLPGGGNSEVPVCRGAFAECSGLEATMEPKVIKEGGRNYGAAQRAGGVSFATVILKRGITTVRDLWRWFEFVTDDGKYAYRLAARITVFDREGTPAADGGAIEYRPLLVWRLDKALPIKFKAPDLNASATEVGIEELHLAHEGLRLIEPAR